MEEQRLSRGFYALISLPATAVGFALCVQISALSWLLSTKFKLDIEQVGFVWMAGPLAGIFGQVLIGFASDRVWFMNGRRRPFIVVGGILASLMLLALPNISYLSETLGLGIMPIAVAVALTLDLAINVGFNPTRSIIADVTPEGPSRTRGFTWMQTISGCFGVVAYGIGATYGNYVLIYVGVGLVFLFSVFPTLFIQEPRELAGQANPDSTEIAPVAESQVVELLKIYLAHAFSWLGIQTMFVYMFAFIKGKFGVGMSDADIGKIIPLAFAVLNIVGFVFPAAVIEPVTKLFGRVRTHSLCLFIMAAGYFAMARLATSSVMLYVTIAFVGVGWAAILSLPFAIFSEKVDRSKMGLHMGIFNLSVVLPQLIVSGLFGGVIQRSDDKSIIFLISAGALAVSSVLWLLVIDRPSLGGAKPVVSGGHH